MRWRRLFGWMDPPAAPTEPAQSTEWCQEITTKEREFLNANGWKCPDCKTGTLMWGPEGGCSVNVTCNHCEAQFNLSESHGRFSGQRLAVGAPPTIH